MKTKLSLLLIIFIFFASCSTPKFYSEITSTYPVENKDDYLKSSFKPHKIVLNHLKENLINSDHIIYHFSIEPEWNSKVFYGVLYDVTNNEHYYYENSENKPRSITVKENNKFPEDDYFKFVMDNYRNGKIDYLKQLGEKSSHSGIRTQEVIYDINLKTGKYQRNIFKDFLFMYGKPTLDIN